MATRPASGGSFGNQMNGVTSLLDLKINSESLMFGSFWIQMLALNSILTWLIYVYR